MKHSLFIFTPCLPHQSHPVHWDQAKKSVFQSLESSPTQVQELFTLEPFLFGTTSRCLFMQPFRLLPSKKHLKTRFFDLAFPPIDTSTPDDPLMLRNCFIDFAVEHQFGCCATEPGFTGDIGAIEIWLIDWFTRTLSGKLPSSQNWDVALVCKSF